MVRAFLKSFKGEKTSSGYIFTTNQDLFLESLCSTKSFDERDSLFGEFGHWRYNHYPLDKIINIPGAPEDFHLKTSNLDSKTISKKIYQELTSPPFLNYIKLHGSTKLQEDKKDILLFGGSDKDPGEFEFTKTNFQIFEECLIQCERIFFIGFSFYDKGILTRLAASQARRQTLLKAIIINPTPQYKLIEPHETRPFIESGIWPYITHYLPCTLQEIFPGSKKRNESPTFWRKQLEEILGRPIDPYDY